MQSWIPSACSLVLTFTVIGCGGPATPPTPPPAAVPAPTAATPPASPVMDPKGTIDTTKAVAAAASAATGTRQVAAGVPPAPGAQPGHVASPNAVAAAAAPALTPTAPRYEPGGRRDPFESLEIKVGSDRSTVAAAKLTGVVRSGATAFALVETSDGIGYILKTGDTLADGRLVEITGNTAVFAIAPKPGSTTNKVVLRLPSD